MDNGVQAIIFDFGNVISVPQDEAGWDEHLDDLAAELGFESGAALWSYLYDGEAWWLAKTGQISEAEFWRRLLEPHGLAVLAHRQAWVARLFKPMGGAHPRMRALLERLRGAYKLALLSNASDWLETALEEEFQLADLFDVVVTSAAVGLAKPDPAIYRLTLERLGVEPSQALFIDDQARNTEAAEALGIASIVFPGVDALWELFEARGLV
jgi:epoxide hydrolase-like predicted phosphatase